MKLFVCRFAQQWESFRLPELESVAKMQNVPIDFDPRDYSEQVKMDFCTNVPSHVSLVSLFESKS